MIIEVSNCHNASNWGLYWAETQESIIWTAEVQEFHIRPTHFQLNMLKLSITHLWFPHIWGMFFLSRICTPFFLISLSDLNHWCPHILNVWSGLRLVYWIQQTLIFFSCRKFSSFVILLFLVAGYLLPPHSMYCDKWLSPSVTFWPSLLCYLLAPQDGLKGPQKARNGLYRVSESGNATGRAQQGQSTIRNIKRCIYIIWKFA